MQGGVMATEARTAFRCLVVTMAATCAGLLGPAGAAAAEVPANAFGFGYDSAGQLTAVSDPDGFSAFFDWDANGNRTAITRHASSTVAIASFVPRSAKAGASVR